MIILKKNMKMCLLDLITREVKKKQFEFDPNSI